MPVDTLDAGKAKKYLSDHIACKKWASIFNQNLEAKGDNVTWKCNIDDLWANMQRKQPDVACWHEHYGLWPGNALAIFAAHSRWVHLSTNTLAFYNVIPRLQN
jgi:hypothetical protein